MGGKPWLYDEGFSMAYESGYDQAGGGLHNDPTDPGGLTKYGVAEKYNPGVDIANLTQAEAEQIYHDNYWVPVTRWVPDTHPELREVMFDAAIHGHKHAVRALQRSLGAAPGLKLPDGTPFEPDGIWGPTTRAQLAEALASDTDANLAAGFLVGREDDYDAAVTAGQYPRARGDAFKSRVEALRRWRASAQATP